MKVDEIIEKQIRDLFTGDYGIIIKNFFFYNNIGLGGENRKVEKFEDIPDRYCLEFFKDYHSNSVLFRLMDQVNCDKDTIKVCIADENGGFLTYDRKTGHISIPINKNNLEEFILRTVILECE